MGNGNDLHLGRTQPIDLNGYVPAFAWSPLRSSPDGDPGILIPVCDKLGLPLCRERLVRGCLEKGQAQSQPAYARAAPPSNTPNCQRTGHAKRELEAAIKRSCVACPLRYQFSEVRGAVVL